MNFFEKIFNTLDSIEDFLDERGVLGRLLYVFIKTFLAFLCSAFIVGFIFGAFFLLKGVIGANVAAGIIVFLIAFFFNALKEIL